MNTSRNVKATGASRTLTVRVPFKLKRHSGRKVIMTPEGGSWEVERPTVNTALVKALARAFRWRKQLDEGEYATTEELAKAENINPSYLGRVLRLTLLAPDIIEAVLDGTMGKTIEVQGCLRQLPTDWEKQRAMLKVWN